MIRPPAPDCPWGALPSLAVLALLALTADPARASWSTSSTVNLAVCTAPGVQTWRSAISDGAGGLLITWSDPRGFDLDIYAQHVDAAGVALWPADGVLVCGVPGDQDSPAIAGDGAGGAIVVWRDLRLGPTGNLYAQRIGADGSRQWTLTGVLVCNAPDEQDVPIIVSDRAAVSGASGAIVAWEDWRSGIAIYAQRLSAAGVPQWAANGLRLTDSFAAQFGPVIAGDVGQPGDPYQGAYVAWTQQGVNGYDIVGQHVAPDGTPMWGASGALIGGASGNQLSPVIAATGSDGAVIAWEDHRAATTSIYAQMVTWWGAKDLAVDGVPLCSTSLADQTNPALASDGAAGAIVVWRDTRSGDRVYAQHLDAAGNYAWGSAALAVCDAPGGELFPTVTADGQGGALIAWEDTRSGASSDLYAQRVSAAGQRLWTPAARAVTTAAGSQYQPTIVSSPDSVGIVVWADQRSGGSDIYAQRIPFVVTLGAPDALAGAGGALRVSPNPARGIASFAFTLTAPARVTLAIFDASGRRVRALQGGALGAGAHALAWDAADENGAPCAAGVYFARLVRDGRASAAHTLTLRR